MLVAWRWVVAAMLVLGSMGAADGKVVKSGPKAKASSKSDGGVSLICGRITEGVVTAPSQTACGFEQWFKADLTAQGYQNSGLPPTPPDEHGNTTATVVELGIAMSAILDMNHKDGTLHVRARQTPSPPPPTPLLLLTLDP